MNSILEMTRTVQKFFKVNVTYISFKMCSYTLGRKQICEDRGSAQLECLPPLPSPPEIYFNIYIFNRYIFSIFQIHLFAFQIAHGHRHDISLVITRFNFLRRKEKLLIYDVSGAKSPFILFWPPFL